MMPHPFQQLQRLRNLLKGFPRHDDLTYPDDEFMYYTLATEFHMPPTVVDEQPAYLLDWLMAIHTTVKKVENDNNKP